MGFPYYIMEKTACQFHGLRSVKIGKEKVFF